MYWDAQHLCLLNTLIDTIRWLAKSTGQYVNIACFRSLTITMNIYLEVSQLTVLPLLCAIYRLSQIEQYWQTDLIYGAFGKSLWTFVGSDVHKRLYRPEPV
jgi:hypothetical protein